MYFKNILRRKIIQFVEIKNNYNKLYILLLLVILSKMQLLILINDCDIEEKKKPLLTL